MARNKEKGDVLIESVRSKDGDALFLQTDVTDEAVLKQNAEAIIARYGKIDALINGAGGNMPGATIGPKNTIFDLKMDDFRKVVDLNLMGTVVPTVIFAEYMVKEKKGNIINISSASALRPLSRVAGYGAAKAAVTNFTKYKEVASSTSRSSLFSSGKQLRPVHFINSLFVDVHQSINSEHINTHVDVSVVRIKHILLYFCTFSIKFRTILMYSS